MIGMSASRLMLQVAAQSSIFSQVMAKPFEIYTLMAAVEQAFGTIGATQEQGIDNAHALTQCIR